MSTWPSADRVTYTLARFEDIFRESRSVVLRYVRVQTCIDDLHTINSQHGFDAEITVHLAEAQEALDKRLTHTAWAHVAAVLDLLEVRLKSE